VNRAIVHLFVVVLVLFAGLLAWTSRWAVFESEELRANTLNARSLLQEQRINRGPIRARDGTLLARSVEAGGGTYSRRYPQDGLFAHALGYSYLTLGRTGLERSRNDELVGERDEVTTVLDQLTGKQRDGDEVRTTLDPRGQRAALQALGGQRGAVVALEPSTGRIRVMASSPSFDPNELREAASLDALGDGSALNRVTLGQYAPGSTFKVLTAVAAVDSGRYRPDSTFDGSSPQTISGAPLRNFGDQDFGQVTLRESLTRSVNTVFANLGVDLGADTMQEYMERFGFFERAPVDLPPQERAQSGVRVAGEDGFTEVTSDRVDVGRVAIGQGGLLVTPLQMAMIAAAVANEGRLMRPTLTERIVDRDGRTVRRVEPQEIRRVMSAQTARAVGDMMADVVREGTGTAAALQGAPVAGKTGTAEVDVANDVNQPWFIAFAPRQDPDIAIAVTLERSSGTGGTVGAPIARQVLEALIR
jgi:penicillin-binding protein A